VNGISERKLQRFRFLKYLYERTSGSTNVGVTYEEIAEAVGLSRRDLLDTSTYLAQEGLIEANTGACTLSHTGVVEIEAALSQPDRPTAHFPLNIIHIEQMSHSQIQQGTVGSTQSGTFTSLDLGAVAEFVRELKAQLSQLGLAGDDEAVAQSDIATIETQLSSPRPKVEIVKESLRSIRNIAEGAVGSMIASGVVAGVIKLLGM
jgi:hypothetical protein